MLTASDRDGIGLAGSTLRELPVESLTCKACGRHTVTRDLPPIGIDVVAVLEQLAGAARTARQSHGVRAGPPMCRCGARALTWSTTVALTVHTAGTMMLGEVSAEMSAGAQDGTLTCDACSRSWSVSRTDLPAQIRTATDAFIAVLISGDLRPGD